MPFTPGVSGNPNGRIPKKEKETPRQIRNKEFLSLLRKLKPLQAKAIKTAGEILMDEEASEGGKLRASALLIQTYKDLVKEVYADAKAGEASDEEAPEVEDSKPAPVFSLKMLDSDQEQV